MMPRRAANGCAGLTTVTKGMPSSGSACSSSGTLGNEPMTPMLQVAQFRERLSVIEAIDFFQANGREQVQALIDTLESRADASVINEEVAMSSEPNAALSGRTWVTRANIQVDRMASAWLIKRSIDPEANFKFVTDRNYQPVPG